MDEYDDIYYLDDARNARVRDHRVTGSRPGQVRPRTMVVQGPVRPTYTQPPVYTPTAPVYPPQAPMVYAQQPIIWGEPSPTAGALLGRLTIAQIIELAAQAFAALQSLPPAPSPQRDSDTNTANMIVYQRALAEHAKRDEQIRTLGALVSKLAG